MAVSDAFLNYAAATVIFKFAWTFTVPLILAALASLDYSGRIIATTNILIGLGLAVGPLLAAFIIASSVVYTPMLVAMATAALIATAALVSVSGRT